MNCSIRSTVLYGAVLIGGLTLGACGKKEAPQSTAPAPASTVAIVATPPSPATSLPPANASTVASASSSAAPAVAFAIAEVALGSTVDANHQVTKARDTFATNDKTIYASVATQGVTGGATLNAKWSYLEGQGQLVSNISQSIATEGPAVTTFKVHNPDLWPAGKYQVEISLDGKSVKTQEFQIKKG